MLLYPTREGALRPGNYWRVVFKFAVFANDWFPTLHVFDDLVEAQEKMEELNEMTGGIIHRLSGFSVMSLKSGEIK